MEIIKIVIEEKAAFLLDIDADLLDPALAEFQEELLFQQSRLIDGELEQLADECAGYWYGERVPDSAVAAIVKAAAAHWQRTRGTGALEQRQANLERAQQHWTEKWGKPNDRAELDEALGGC